MEVHTPYMMQVRLPPALTPLTQMPTNGQSVIQVPLDMVYAKTPHVKFLLGWQTPSAAPSPTVFNYYHYSAVSVKMAIVQERGASMRESESGRK